MRPLHPSVVQPGEHGGCRGNADDEQGGGHGCRQRRSDAVDQGRDGENRSAAAEQAEQHADDRAEACCRNHPRPRLLVVMSPFEEQLSRIVPGISCSLQPLASTRGRDAADGAAAGQEAALALT
jgi:hypothetical protein